MWYTNYSTREEFPEMEKKISDNQLRALKKIRGDWGEVKPYTRIERDRKKYNRKQKHKGFEE